MKKELFLASLALVSGLLSYHLASQTPAQQSGTATPQGVEPPPDSQVSPDPNNTAQPSPHPDSTHAPTDVIDEDADKQE